LKDEFLAQTSAANLRLLYGRGDEPSSNIDLQDCTFPGLVNYGNTCFLNSLFQSMAYNPVFKRVLLSSAFVPDTDCFLGHFQSFMQALILSQTSNGYTSDDTKKTRLRDLQECLKKCVGYANANFQDVHAGRQYDPVDLFRYIASDYLTKTLAKNIGDQSNENEANAINAAMPVNAATLVLNNCQQCGEKHSSALDQEMHHFRQIFGHIFERKLICTRDGLNDVIHSMSRPESKNVLELEALDNLNAYLPSVQDAYAYYCAGQQLTATNKFTGCTCQNVRGQTIKDSLSDLSDVLIVQRKIFRSDMAGNVRKVTPASSGLDDSFTFENNQFLQIETSTFELQSIIVHLSYGTCVSLKNGHYIAYVKTDPYDNDSWKKFSDHSPVVAVTFETVKRSDSYMLFYNKKVIGT